MGLQLLQPLQLSVGVPGSSKAVGRAGMVTDVDCDTVQLYFRTAFNTLLRKAALTLMIMQEQAPNLLPFMQWTCRQHTRLSMPGPPKHSQRMLLQSEY